MTNAQAAKHTDFVRSYLRGYIINVRSEDHFERMVDYVRDRGGPGCDKDDLRVCAAMSLLGPGSLGETNALETKVDRFYGAATCPPEVLRNQLLGILRDTIPDDSERNACVREFAIAFGCGKWRKPAKDRDTWEARWQGAFRALIGLVNSGVAKSNDWMGQPGKVVGYPERDPDDFASDSCRLAWRVVHPLASLHIKQDDNLRVSRDTIGTRAAASGFKCRIPAGVKLVFSADRPALVRGSRDRAIQIDLKDRVIVLALDDGVTVSVDKGKKRPRLELSAGESASIDGPVRLIFSRCGCGNVNCENRHSLAHWDPTARSKKGERITLASFIASAVVGPEVNIKTGSFVAGMYYPLLCWEGF